MERKLKGTFNALHNGDLLIQSKVRPDFPEGWLQIGGNRQTRWDYIYQSWERPVIEIRNSSTTRAGIIQTQEDSLDVRKDEIWLITIMFESRLPKLKAYLRLYPIKSNGEWSAPWEFSFNQEVGPKEFKQVISAGLGIKFLRLEVGIKGEGQIFIYKLMAYPLLSKWKTRRVKLLKKKSCTISHIQTIGEITKPIQLAVPISLNIPDYVKANVNPDIRSLTPTRDMVQIYGNSQVPLATSACGRAQVEIYGHGYYESLEVVTANETMSATMIRDVSNLRRFSFAVYNFGTERAYVQAGLSPDGSHWVEAGEQKTVYPGKLVLVSPENFLRYTRLTLWADSETMLRIWVQAQS